MVSLTIISYKNTRKSEKAAYFKNTTVAKYMKLIVYTSDRRGMQQPRRTWCINEEGIKFLLKNMKVTKAGSERDYKLRERAFYACCLYFGIKKPVAKLDPMYIYGFPDMEEYDIWSALCIENDKDVNEFTKWKKCPECNYYYPFQRAYFGEKRKTDTKCLQCRHKDFICKNKVVQYISEHDGLDLLFKLRNNAKPESIVFELHKFIGRGSTNNED